ncbi:MAG: LacI family DNA-binding transcriptional regulator, partial [Victivallales bacterium]|nr:LacI family DNA-binding transcriptional regulator [Victivallales bacterium]
IARRLGISQATVSRALSASSSHLISASVRDRIIALSNELGYRPSLSARSTVKGLTYRVGMILCNMESDLCALDWNRLTCALASYLQRNSYTLLLLKADGPGSATEQSVRELLMSGVADCYVTGPNLLKGGIPELLRQLRIPVSVVCESGTVADVENYLQRDDQPAFQEVWRAMPPECQSKVAFLGPDTVDVRLRLKEVCRAGQAIGRKDKVKTLLYGGFQSGVMTEYRRAYHAARELGNSLKRFRFFWCVSDLVALALCDALREQGRTPGRDVFVVGYGDQETFRGFSETPFLSTISADAGRIGETLGSMVLDHLAGRPRGRVLHLTRYIRRDSFPFP